MKNRRAIAPLIATAASAALLLVPAASAHADSPGCVTKTEYRHAKKGMTMTKVHGIFDTIGKQESKAQSGGYVFLIKSYKVCHSSYSSVVVGYEKHPGGVLKLSNKTAVWVS
jgi:hypothetical protein